MKIMRFLAVIALLIGIGAAPALAQEFNFTYSDSNYVLSGVLTASPDGGGVYTVTSVTGTVAQTSAPSTTYALTLVPPGDVPSNHNGDNVYGQDDLLYLNGGSLLTLDPSYDGLGGLEFAFPAPPPLSGINGGSDIALFADVAGGAPGSYGSYESANLGGYGNTTSAGTFTLSAVPEGGAGLMYLLLAGSSCFGALVYASPRRSGVVGYCNKVARIVTLDAVHCAKLN